MQRSYESDEEAALDLYNSNPNDVRYKMLKHRVKKKFYNNLFLINYQKLKIKSYVQSEQECHLLLHHANLFLKQSDYKLAEINARKIINIANEYDFTSFKIAALEILLFCSSESGAFKSFKKYKQELDELMLRKSYEREGVSLFQLIKIKLNKSVKSRREYLPQLEKDVAKLEMLWQKSKTFDSFNAYYKGYIWYNELIGNFSKIVELTVLSEKLLEAGEVCRQRFDASYNKYVLVYAHLKAAKYEKGLLYAEKYFNEFNQNSNNWFAYLENYHLLAVHSQKYELASILLDKVFSNSFYNKISPVAKERWQLYQAYLSIIDGNLYVKKVSNPYLISLPEYSKDKQGFNVAILILQFFYFLQKQDVEALLYRIESLKKYVHTHLKDSFSLRSKLFLKLLILAVTEDFEPESCRKKGLKHYEKLRDTPAPGDAYAEIEIVPYEHLWNLILTMLQKRY
ncbi:hypothetical protein [uncultured Pontibacter sp.]|uniref:hypothetical protein n=1 Tax=uncultured Pontibacter sp. TaxID=453356 RepID=UPI0026062039|nr:hypothetical protein [uncultured Pontibacter sp.]